MRTGAWILAAGLLAAALVLNAGCGGRKVARVDVSAGEYYSEDDYEALSRGGKNRYCEDLQAEMTRTQTEFEEKTVELQRMKDMIESIEKQIIPLEREILQLEAEVRTLNGQIDVVKALPKAWKVKPGDSLTLISMNEKIYNDIDKWWRIFEANMHQIQDPYYIFPDSVLIIPRDWPTD